LDLPSKVIDSISNSFINPSTAEELLSIKDKKQQSEFANLAKAKSLSSRDIRELIKDVKRNSVYDYSIDNTLGESSINNIDKKTQRCFDKSIIALRIAMNKISSIIEETQENWIIYEILMHHKSMLHNEIDLLIKEKMRL
jgi:ParB family chromosome partitioning protein